MTISPPLRDIQRKMINLMINFGKNSSISTEREFDNPWKVLIFDQSAQDILSPIIKVHELREGGVTLYLLIKSVRQAIPDVPAIYFVEPTQENIDFIIRDLQSGLYEKFYINFTSHVPRSLLEDLAIKCGPEISRNIIKIQDQYLNYRCLEDNLFTLGIPDAFSIINCSGSSEDSMEPIIEKCANGLFSVLLSQGGSPPIICSVKSSAAESVAARLDVRIRDHLGNIKSQLLSPTSLPSNSTNTFPSSPPSSPLPSSMERIERENQITSRPILLIVERCVDLVTLLEHPSTYNALCHDLLGMKLNRLLINLKDGEGRKDFSIDHDDWFWKENSGLLFPTVAENAESALKKWKKDYELVTRTNVLDPIGGNNEKSGLGSMEGGDLAMLNAEQLKMAVTLVPELTAKKKLIDMHLFTCQALLNEIKKRDLAFLFNIEQNIASETKSNIMSLIRKESTVATGTTIGSGATSGTAISGSTGGIPNSTDKLRLFIAYYLAVDISKGDMVEFEVALKEAGCDMRAFEAIRNLKSFLKINNRLYSQSPSLTGNQSSASPPSPLNANSGGTGMGMGIGGVIGGSGGVINRMQSGLKEAGSGLWGKVKNILSDESEKSLIRHIDMAIELLTGISGGVSLRLNSPSVRAEDVLLVHDPRLPRNLQQNGKQAGGNNVGGVSNQKNLGGGNASLSLSFGSSSSASTSSHNQLIVFVVGGSNYIEYGMVMDHLNKKRANLKLSLLFGATEMITGEEFVKEIAGTIIK